MIYLVIYIIFVDFSLSYFFIDQLYLHNISSRVCILGIYRFLFRYLLILQWLTQIFLQSFFTLQLHKGLICISDLLVCAFSLCLVLGTALTDFYSASDEYLVKSLDGSEVFVYKCNNVFSLRLFLTFFVACLDKLYDISFLVGFLRCVLCR